MPQPHKWVHPLINEVLESHPLMVPDASTELEKNLVSQGCDREFNKTEQDRVARKVMSLMGIVAEEP